MWRKPQRRRPLKIALCAALIWPVACVAAFAQTSGTVLRGSAAFGGYTSDAPGVWREITPADLPAPFAREAPGRPSQRRLQSKVGMPRVPPGFSVSVFARGFRLPRQMKVAPNGDVFLADSGTGSIHVLRADPDSATAASDSVFATVAPRPFGLAFYPSGPDPRWLYVASTTEIVRFPYHAGDTRARGKAETVVDDLPAGGHWTRDVLVLPDDRHILVSVGSSSNIQDNGPAAERWRADILEFNPDGSGRRVFASGLRNPVAMALDPVGGAVWTSVNERDLMGDNLPPDYVTHVEEGKFYGWPYFYIGGHPDPRVSGKAPVPAAQVTVPDVLIQAHSAPLGIAFYTGTQFPPEYRGDLFVALHGSWNRSQKTGYKLIRVKMRDGRATGEYEDFVTGFVVSNGQVWGRPVGVAVARDGALLMSDDESGTVWRIAYTGTGVAH